MFEQHPVPQNISSYQFHLVGDMTLKQFLELAAGVLVAVLIYTTGLPVFIKVPLILFSAGLGAALAFVPFEERPLEQWIFSFFRSVYSPTLFHWEKRPNVKYFQDESATAVVTHGQIKPLSNLDASETNFLTRLSGIFNPVSTAPTPQAAAPAPQPQVATPVVAPAATAPAAPVVMTGTLPNTNGNLLTMHPVNSSTDLQTPQNNNPIKREVQVPQTTYISLDKQTNRPQVFVEETPQAPVNLETTKVNETLPGKTITENTIANTQQPQFSTQAANPSFPTITNTVSGQVMDAQGNIIEGVVLSIMDKEGRPVRALRTNKAGHFLNVTPLVNGTYELMLEKEGFSFDPISFEVKGEIVPPIAVRAKATN